MQNWLSIFQMRCVLVHMHEVKEKENYFGKKAWLASVLGCSRSEEVTVLSENPYEICTRLHLMFHKNWGEKDDINSFYHAIGAIIVIRLEYDRIIPTQQKFSFIINLN